LGVVYRSYRATRIGNEGRALEDIWKQKLINANLGESVRPGRQAAGQVLPSVRRCAEISSLSLRKAWTPKPCALTLVWGTKRIAANVEIRMSEVTQMLHAVVRGEKGASEDLLPLVYEQLRRLATARMALESGGQTLQGTALVHEAWLRLVKEGERKWENRAIFFAAAAEAMRRILIENARRKSRLKRGGAGLVRVALADIDLADSTPDDRILMIGEALERLETTDPEAARLVVMKFFGGMTNQEVASNLGMTERTVERRWAYAKAWLLSTIKEMQ